MKQASQITIMLQKKSSVLIWQQLLELMASQTFRIRISNNTNSSNNLKMKMKIRIKLMQIVMIMITCIHKWHNRINNKWINKMLICNSSNKLLIGIRLMKWPRLIMPNLMRQSEVVRQKMVQHYRLSIKTNKASSSKSNSSNSNNKYLVALSEAQVIN